MELALRPDLAAQLLQRCGDDRLGRLAEARAADPERLFVDEVAGHRRRAAAAPAPAAAASSSSTAPPSRRLEMASRKLRGRDTDRHEPWRQRWRVEDASSERLVIGLLHFDVQQAQRVQARFAIRHDSLDEGIRAPRFGEERDRNCLPKRVELEPGRSDRTHHRGVGNRTHGHAAPCARAAQYPCASSRCGRIMRSRRANARARARAIRAANSPERVADDEQRDVAFVRASVNGVRLSLHHFPVCDLDRPAVERLLRDISVSTADIRERASERERERERARARAHAPARRDRRRGWRCSSRAKL